MTAISKQDKLKQLNISIIDDLTEEQITLLYNQSKKQKKKIAISREEEIDKTTDKYILLLEYVNKILENMNKNPINDLLEFKNIDRLDIIKDDNIKILDTMAPRLFKKFNKDKCGYYRKVDSIALNCLRGMCKELGLCLITEKKDITHRIGEATGFRKTHQMYTII